MLETPFTVISCSWPRPAREANLCWISEPEWHAPLMPARPEPSWEMIDGEFCWTIDWRRLFKGGLRPYEPHLGGEMRGYHVVFNLRINGTGRLLFWDDDGSIIRRNGEIVHCDRSAHALKSSAIDVTAGDSLEVAQWQLDNDWLWGARLIPLDDGHEAGLGSLLAYLDLVRQRLRQPNGPPLKLYTDGQTPMRTVVSIYSMILNGYVPSELLLFGDYQWSVQRRELFALLLPFARVVPGAHVFDRIRYLGGAQLEEMARQFWWVMKTLIALLYPPGEFCLMDDDVFVLDDLDDALRAFERHDLVFAPDMDHSSVYLAHWGEVKELSAPWRTGKFNAGLYWMRSSRDPRALAIQALRLRPEDLSSFIWEQGLIASVYALKNVFQLPSQRYFFALFDGLPGGKLGYDYALNPCEFAMIHFGGLFNKPTDAETLLLAADVLGRGRRRRELAAGLRALTTAAA
jgi:hypothetical protein